MDFIISAVEAFSNMLVSAVFKSVNIMGVDIQLIVLWLFSGMLFFTFRLGFVNVRGFGIGFRALRGDYTHANAPGQLSPFQALSTALSSTVGLGNIAGVAIAISIGGPGAAFWMVFIGFFAMSLKFAEVTLAVKYRDIDESGTVRGGPMFYLERGLAERGLPKLGRFLGCTYAVFALIAFIQILQVNQSYSQINTVMGIGDNKFVAFGYGCLVAALVALVLIGGVKSVSKVTSKLTPFMCALYLISVAVVLFANASNILPAIGQILSSAFSTEAGIGGLIGSFVVGMRRAVYSNEAGIGSSAIAHATVKTDHAASEGYVALLEPFIDTFIVCSATALLIVSTGVWDKGYGDIAMTSAAFETVSAWFPIMLAVCVSIFAFSTMLAAGFYGQQLAAYLFKDKIWLRRSYAVLFCALLPIGTIVDFKTIINIIDSMFFLLAIPNLIGLFLMSGVIVQEVKKFKSARENDERSS